MFHAQLAGDALSVLPSDEKRALLVGGTPSSRASVREKLEACRWVVFDAGRGGAAVPATNALPDVIVVDVDRLARRGSAVPPDVGAWAAAEHVPVVLVGPPADPRAVADALDSGAHDYVTMPVSDVELAARLGVARRLKQSVDRLQRVARVDTLTGLYNRRHLNEQLRAAASASARRGHPFAVGIVDLDHFKVVNDRHGHDVGDQVLRSVAKALVSAARAEDVVGRWGGEEFLVVLPTANAREAACAADRLLVVVRSLTTATEAGALRLTASAGVASGAGDDPHRLVLAADAALYRAKAQGRDRVCADQ